MAPVPPARRRIARREVSVAAIPWPSRSISSTLRSAAGSSRLRRSRWRRRSGRSSSAVSRSTATRSTRRRCSSRRRRRPNGSSSSGAVSWPSCPGRSRRREPASCSRRKPPGSNRASRRAVPCWAISTSGVSAGDGFGQYLSGLARQRVEGVWLTKVAVHASSGDMVLEGRALSAERVPAYLGQLRRDTVFAGRSRRRAQDHRTRDTGRGARHAAARRAGGLCRVQHEPAAQHGAGEHGRHA